LTNYRKISSNRKKISTYGNDKIYQLAITRIYIDKL